MKHLMTAFCTCLMTVMFSLCPAQAGYDTATALADLPYLGIDPGTARVAHGDGWFALGNGALEQSFTTDGGRFANAQFSDRINGVEVKLATEPFRVHFADGTVICAGDMEIANGPVIETLVTNQTSPCLARRLPGKCVTIKLIDPDVVLAVEWRAILLDGSNYIRQELLLSPLTDVRIENIQMFNGTPEGIAPGGNCDGVPALAGYSFLGIEHPLATNLAGVEEQQVADWQPTLMNYPDPAVTAWNLDDAIPGDGPYEITFQYTDGGYRLEVSWAALIQDGVELARDEHFGATGIAQIDNTYLFDVSGYNPTGGPVELHALTRADGGTDSTGVIHLRDLNQPARLDCRLPLGTDLGPGDELAVSAVAGAAPPGQMRRAFQYYLERERAHPYRTFLHYNSWYDIGYFSKYTEQDCLDVVEAYRRELVEKRGVPLDSFLFDDGWDDYDSLWDFHDGFPDGFTKVGEATRGFGAGLGVWLSPWGGYGDPREQRIAASEGRGYEINSGGFALSGPNYYERFREICLEMIKDYNANQFKIDGLGRGTGRVPGSEFVSDFDAAIHLIGEMRIARDDVFVNLTTGTWPSPFWLRYADSIYRGGWDHSFIGEGSDRQQWMTYRDGETYRNIARSSPLFPLNSLMLHGVIYAEHAHKLNTATADELRNEFRSYFASGTQLQELYITPGMLTGENWDDLAASARWARDNAVILKDVHWVGGDPHLLEVYGWAAWRPEGAVLCLRNPAATVQEIEIGLGGTFDIPYGHYVDFNLVSPYPDQRISEIIPPGKSKVPITLEPFEVLVFNSVPQ